jgi:FkbH-like protein
VTTHPTKPAEYLQAARAIEAAGGPAARKLAIVSTFTAELLRPYLIVESQRLGPWVQPWFGPFGQLEQPVLDAASPLWQEAPDVLWIAARLEDVDRYLVHESPAIGPVATKARLDAIRARLVSLARAARDISPASILVSNLAQDAAHELDVFDANDPEGFVHLLAECNRELARDLSQIADAHVFDYAGTLRACGAARWTDPKLWYMARSGCGSPNMIALARNLSRAVAALLRPAAKCLVLDLDNTLWGGVLGDDGPEGIKLGDEYPGNVFKDFQAALLGLRRRGFLLAIASKNDEQTVLELLDTHPEMLLRREHFAAIVANWEPKPAHLRHIARTLNIGLDALVFLDDNPVERAAIRAELPMVHVVELPRDPLGYLEALRQIVLLDRPRLAAEDRRRAEMYASDALRQQSAQQATSVAAFLVSLDMEAQVGRCDATTLERVHQLIQKTNQFNLTTRRHKLDDVRRLSQSPDAAVAWLRLADRYGDSGLVCAGIVERADERTWVIDTLLMSCRVMGRHVEDAFLSYLAELAREGGAQVLRGVYRPTAKNAPMKAFYPQRGFVAAGDDGGLVYEAPLSADAFPWPDMIRRVPQPRQENVRV